MHYKTQAAADRRALAWGVACSLPEFTQHSFQHHLGMGYKAARSICQDWLAHKLVTVTEAKPGRRQRKIYAVKTIYRGAKTYEEALASTHGKGTPQGNMWRAMRGLVTFTATDIAIHANVEPVRVSLDDAVAYCTALEEAKYIRVDARASRSRSEPVFRILRNTGINPPVQRAVLAIWDENLGAFTHAPGVLA